MTSNQELSPQHSALSTQYSVSAKDANLPLLKQALNDL